jgi:MFS family permease
LAFPLLVLAITGSPAQASLVSAAHLISLVVVVALAGPLVDRWDRRRILIGCEAARALGMASVAAAVFAGSVVLPHLLAVALVQGAANALFNPARITAVRAVVPRSQLGSALAQEEVRTHAAALAGPPLAGALFGLGRAVPFVLDSVSYLVSLVCIVGARVPRRPATGSATGGGRARLPGQIVDGLQWLWKRPFVRAVCGFSLTLNVFAGGIVLTVIVLVSERHGSPVFVGIATATMGAGGLLGAALAAPISRLLPPGRLVLAFGWWFAVLLPVTALPLGVLWPGVALALVALVMPALTVALQTTVLSEVPDQMLGRISSMLMLASLGLAPLGPLLSGFLTQAFGPVATLIVQGGLVAGVSAVATMSPTLRLAKGCGFVVGSEPAPRDR